MIADSDDETEGDLVFTFRVDNQPARQIEVGAESGITIDSPLPPPFDVIALFIVDDAPVTTTLKVQGCDDSADFPQTLNECLTRVGFGSTGRHKNAAYSCVEEIFDHSKKTGLNENHSVIFKLTPTGPVTLAFMVRGVYHVSYV